MIHRQASRDRSELLRRGFTLTELLVVVAIIGILATLTLVGVQAVTKDARIASGQNAVVAALSVARSTAMKENKPVLVAFRAKMINEHEQVIEAVTAMFSGQSYENGVVGNVDRFIPVPDVAARALPKGIKLAAPFYAIDEDEVWTVSSDLRAIGRPSNAEAGGVVVAVMYSPDGTVITNNPRTDSHTIFVDFNNDGGQQQGGEALHPFAIDNSGYCDQGMGSQPNRFQCQMAPDDEPYLTMAPFLAVFDDEEARELYDVSTWSDPVARIDDLSRYVTEYAGRIHFNRYTGVVMK